MGKKVYLDVAAEREAIEAGKKFMNSSDVVADMSRAYGTDLSSVKIHVDSDAQRRTRERGVDAFSTGREIYFSQEAYDKNDPASRGLLAHELSHSLQQGIGGGMSGMEYAVPSGAEQGGFRDWFRGLFGKRKNKEDELNFREKNESNFKLSDKKARLNGSEDSYDLVMNNMKPQDIDPESAYSNKRKDLDSFLKQRYEGKEEETLFADDLRNASGTVVLGGILPGRMMSILRGAAGGTASNEEIGQIYDDLLSGGEIAALNKVVSTNIGPDGAPTEKSLAAKEKISESYTEDEIAARDKRFDHGVYQLKGMYLNQLRRMKEKYGTYITQMHPEDFAEKAGYSYLEDISMMQDVTILMKDGARYFDFENNPEDKEFKQLADYYFNALCVIAAYYGSDMTPERKEFNPNIDFVQMMDSTGYVREAYSDEKNIDAPGFTEKEYRGYVKRLQNRFKKSGRRDRLFGRYKQK